MRRFEDIAITVITMAIGFSALVYNVAGTLAPDAVPVPEQSTLESRAYQERPTLSEESLLDGSYQGEFEKFLSDHVPSRNTVMLANAALQRMSIAVSAAVHGYEVYPTFFGSHYYAVPRDGLVVDRAEALPSGGSLLALEAWTDTLNDASRKHPDISFVYDCVARHDQTEANPTYRYYRDRLDPTWLRENLIDRLDPSIDAFVDSVDSYDEIREEWFNADPHWKLERALESYNRVAGRLNLKTYSYEDPVEAIHSWYGGYAKGGLDLSNATTLEDLPIDFPQLSFRALREDGGGEKYMGHRDEVLFDGAVMNTDVPSAYYEYFGGGSGEAHNSGENNGRTALFIGDSLSYCLARFIAANYADTVFLLPGNGPYETSLEDYLELYQPDDVIVMMHASKFESIAEYSPKFLGLE